MGQDPEARQREAVGGEEEEVEGAEGGHLHAEQGDHGHHHHPDGADQQAGADQAPGLPLAGDLPTGLGQEEAARHPVAHGHRRCAPHLRPRRHHEAHDGPQGHQGGEPVEEAAGAARPTHLRPQPGPGSFHRHRIGRSGARVEESVWPAVSSPGTRPGPRRPRPHPPRR